MAAGIIVRVVFSGESVEEGKAKWARVVRGRGGGGGKGVGVDVGAEGAGTRRVSRRVELSRSAGGGCGHVEVLVELPHRAGHVRLLLLGEVPRVVVVGAGRPSVHRQLLDRTGHLLLGHPLGTLLHLLKGVDEVASRSIGTETHAVVSPAQVCLVLGMAVDVADLVHAVGELALVAVLACAVLLERSAHLGLVPRRLLSAIVAAGGVWGGWGVGLA